MTETALVPASNMSTLDTLDDSAREVAITGMLDQARTWLAHAVESSAPAQDIANFKAWVATTAEATRRLKVSREIQLDAEVMVRRTERALGEAIREGQAAGEIRKRGEIITSHDRWSGDAHQTMNSTKAAPTDFASSAELSGPSSNGIYAMTDGVSPEVFEAALTEAQAERNVSRANVVRKVRQATTNEPTEKWDRVAEMAERGNASAQIARELGVNEAKLREGARARGIDIRADRIIGKSRRLDITRVVRETVSQLDAITTTVHLITSEALTGTHIDPDEAQTWVDSLTSSITALTKVRKTIKESTRE